jgi:hypothetical protein
MKHIYYGLKQEEVLWKDSFEIHDLKIRAEFSDSLYTYYKDRIEHHIKELERGSSYLIRTHSFTHDNEVFMSEKRHDHILEVDEFFELGKYQGKVNSRTYDAENDVMHYYTNAVVIKTQEENLEEKKEDYRKELIHELKSIYYGANYKEKEEKAKYKELVKEEETKAKNESKGFWARLFG